MPVIDCDCHFETTIERDEHPFREVLSSMPDSREVIRYAMTEDLARAAFLGENLAECFARMGDPLPVS